VQFLSEAQTIDGNRYRLGVLVDIHFKKKVELNNVASLSMRYCRYDDLFEFTLRDCEVKEYKLEVRDRIIDIAYSHFTNFKYQIFCETSSSNLSNYLIENQFKASKIDDVFLLSNSDTRNLLFSGNRLEYDRGIFLGSLKTQNTSLRNNTFESGYIQQFINNVSGKIIWTGNSYSSPVYITADPFSPNNIIDLEQFQKGFGSYSALMTYTLETVNKYPVHITDNRQSILSTYLDSVRVYNDDVFRQEISLKSQFFSHFKSRYNTEIANKMYIDLKDFETKRLKVLYEQNPGFRTYFKWKVNQFLKIFSDYGTEPSKAIVFSVYVILSFALIYLFFPNSWDRHGRRRIMDRFRFFTKYMNREAGIHQVYLEEQKQELLESEDFKDYMLKAEKHIPKFFIATAMPLYHWSVSGTKLWATLLKRVDIMRGSWSELPQSRRFWKSALLIGAFLMAVIYDIFIKMLNALMLSINTFTTLGFGEIPIKGLPRYLAIIQGFIGWFMLTIFSVSLISQLLN
jgi:hypothetical protein